MIFGSTESTNVKHATRSRESHYTGDCSFCRPNRGCNKFKRWKAFTGRKNRDTK